MLPNRNLLFKPDEEKRLFAQLDKCEWLKPIVRFTLNTGMRRGEICGFQWFDLNFDRGLIHVRDTKNGKDRIIPMNRTVRRLLEMQKELRAQPRKNRDGTPKVPSVCVSKSANGRGS